MFKKSGRNIFPKAKWKTLTVACWWEDDQCFLRFDWFGWNFFHPRFWMNLSAAFGGDFGWKTWMNFSPPSAAIFTYKSVRNWTFSAAFGGNFGWKTWKTWMKIFAAFGGGFGWMFWKNFFAASRRSWMNFIQNVAKKTLIMWQVVRSLRRMPTDSNRRQL